MGTLASKHRSRPGWWRRFFDSMGEGTNRTGWIPWGWDAGIYPESMAGPYWPTMRGARGMPRRHPHHPHRPAHHPHHHRGASA